MMIFIHELGHFLTARLFHVRVNEFAIGMGPVLFKKQRGETLYSIRALPIGGFCAMEGEDEESENEGAFGKKPAWQRCIILSAGAVMNFIAGFLILILLFIPVQTYVSPEINGFSEGFPLQGEGMLQTGDELFKINGYRIYTYNDVGMFLDSGSGEPYDFTVIRGGEKIELPDLPLEKRLYPTEVMTEEGAKVESVLRYGLEFKPKQVGFFDQFRLAAYYAIDFVRMIKISLVDLFSGKASVSDISGPVGITSTLTATAKTSLSGLLMLVALITINLSVMNLLPLPALDGGRIFFLVIELLRGKPISPKYEGIVHTVGIILLFGLMAYVSFNDIVRMLS